MSGLLQEILWSLGGTVIDVLPIITIILVFQLVLLRRPIPRAKRVFLGFVYVIIGLSLFLVGLERALFPLGELMAEQLTRPEFIYTHAAELDLHVDWKDYYWIYIFAAAIGFSTTIAEPSLIAVAIKANEVSGGAIGVWGLRVAVALGVAIGIALGSYRIVVGDPLHYYILAGYVVVVIQTFIAPKLIIPLAYDSGGVTTSTVTVPLVAALGLGLAETVPGRNPLVDGFGLIAFASLFPIITVMAYAQMSEWMEQRKAQSSSQELS
ncbi:DUF1538 domain-containing protein [Corallincola platygyrae]|uniref:DUF1538 domain-containing protein n=1 Tax=Corallincola platygyrae TaxID=1193278 RepID=A0ABW4XK96_9GAMM